MQQNNVATIDGMSVDNQTIPNYVNLEEKLEGYERTLWSLIKSRGAVPILMGAPGTGKSAIANGLTEKLDLQYIDLRLATLDETDLGIFPSKEIYTDEDGVTHKYVEHLYPHWAVLANQRPTLIHFEEINRTTNAKRNACLQILNEKTMGYNFKFNDNVFFIASGNLGKEDGTEVDELENAILNRFVVVKHELSIDQWVKEFARKNGIHEDIINFLLERTEFFNKPNKIESSVNSTSVYSSCYPSPRAWTNFSKWLTVNNFKLDDDKFSKTILPTVLLGFVGTLATTSFLDYLTTKVRINYLQVLNEYSKYKKDIEKLDRVEREVIFGEIVKLSIFSSNVSKTQYGNIVKFIDSCLSKNNTPNQDERFLDGVAGYIQNILTSADTDVCLAKHDNNQELMPYWERREDFMKKYNYIINEIKEEIEKN
jgi:hypothetical protein